jgi:dihydroxyacetone kinase
LKKLINDPDRVVAEMLEGLLALNPNVSSLAGRNVVVRSDSAFNPSSEVSLISGGGSGHEPAHAGYVGPGMLTAAVAGEVFTSPPVDAVAAAIRAVTGPAGCLLIVKNYTGDRLNFGLAAEMARAEGIAVETVVVADDVATTGAPTGSRGLAGTVLVHKIAGAAAAEGRSLAEVTKVARHAIANLSTMGVSLASGTLPVTGKASFELGPDELEIGLGIHGEPGVRRGRLKRADELADEMLDALVAAGTARVGDRTALLVNNLGATTTMELAIIARRALAYLRACGIAVERLYAGTFLTSLDMSGVSLTLLNLDDGLLRLLDAPTDAPAWPRLPAKAPGLLQHRAVSAESRTPRRTHSEADGGVFARCVRSVSDALLAAEPLLTDLDSAVGDGDLGASMARMARALVETLPELTTSAGSALKELAGTTQSSLGGSSGPLYAALLVRAGSLLEASPAPGPREWADAIQAGCQAVEELGGAAQGDRTMLDALVPFANTFRLEILSGSSVQQALPKAAEAARAGAEKTASMVPRRGRSSYLGERCLGVPDPGAVAITVWVDALAASLLS